MKFSYTLIKQLVPKIRNKKELIDILNLYAFEAADMRGKTFDVVIPPNRFSDAASHLGIAREAAAILGARLHNQKAQVRNQKFGSAKAPFKIEIKDKELCPRYAAQYFENIKVASSPQWLEKILKECGLRPVNNVVDIMNYVMLEVGQPLHAFDYDKISGSKSQKSIIVRRAAGGEKITAIDGKAYNLSGNALVIADIKGPIAIAGIKGGKGTEVDKKTKRIIVEAANFYPVSIYQSSKALELRTDAAVRFSHGLSPELVFTGLNRAAELLKSVVKAEVGRTKDENFSKSRKVIIKFDVEKFNQFTGLKLDFKEVRRYLESLGFEISGQSLVGVPIFRPDIETFEDVAEEVARLYGYNRVKAAPPKIHLAPSGFEDQIVLKDKIRKVFVGFGLSEVYNYSFVSGKDNFPQEMGGEKAIELENPLSSQFRYLRSTLASNLLKNAESNFRFSNQFKIFEIGKVFSASEDGVKERTAVGIAFASKTTETFFDLKGAINEFLKKIGLVDFLVAEQNIEELKREPVSNYMSRGDVLAVKSGGIVLGYLGKIKSELTEGHVSLCELDLDKLLELVVGEHEYRPLAKYPAVMRDASFTLAGPVRIGNIIQAIQEVNKKLIEDVDLIDEYKDSFTLRIVFQAPDRTLTSREVDKEMQKIIQLLKANFKARIR